MSIGGLLHEAVARKLLAHRKASSLQRKSIFIFHKNFIDGFVLFMSFEAEELLHNPYEQKALTVHWVSAS